MRRAEADGGTRTPDPFITSQTSVSHQGHKRPDQATTGIRAGHAETAPDSRNASRSPLARVPRAEGAGERLQAPVHVLEMHPARTMCGEPVQVGGTYVRWGHWQHATCTACRDEAARR